MVLPWLNGDIVPVGCQRTDGTWWFYILCPCCKSPAPYPGYGMKAKKESARLFWSNRGRRCSCTLALDLNKFQDQSMLHRRSNPNGTPKGGTFADQKATDKLPSLVEFLTVTEWAPNEPRDPGSFTIFVADGRVKVCFNDKDANMSAFASLDTLVDCLKEMEQLLAKDDLDWRKNAWDRKGGKGKK